MGLLVGTANSLQVYDTDLLRGLLDIRRSLRERRKRINPLWRYYPRNMKIISRRFHAIERQMPPHDAVLQFSGIGALPMPGVHLAAHVEITAETAAGLPDFAPQYGFANHSKKALAEAVAGEREYLEQCAVVFTNSSWCAEGLRKQGVPGSRICIQPPAAGAVDPGPIDRCWERCHIVFIGIDWQRKGGPLLVEAFQQVRRAVPGAKLTIVGCDPHVHDEDIEVAGFLAKNIPAQRQRLEKILRDATIFCMPSYWESTGLVYMEAALYGLPVVMLRGQGREEIFPPEMAIHLEQATAAALAEQLIHLAGHPDLMAGMGRAGRAISLRSYTWQAVAPRMVAAIREAIGRR
jgi:glycosyltransferase involved in cell wall biosynthesis